MSNSLIEQIPKLENLPRIMPTENAVRLEIEEGIVIFRASKSIQNRIEDLLEKRSHTNLSSRELKELEAFGEIDDYLSHVNRLIRNSYKTSEVDIAA